MLYANEIFHACVRQEEFRKSGTRQLSGVGGRISENGFLHQPLVFGVWEHGVLAVILHTEKLYQKILEEKKYNYSLEV